MINHARTTIAGTRQFALLILALAAIAGACSSKTAAPPASANAWAVVNSHEITRDEVDKAYKRSEQGGQPQTDEEALGVKLSLLDDLIAQEVFVERAQALKIDIPQADLDKAYAESHKNIPDEAFKQELAKRSLTEADMRDALRREMLVQKLFEREVSSKVSATDQEVAAFFEANKAQFNRTEDAYHVAQIVVTPTREAQITNRTGSDATTPLEAVEKYRMLVDKLKSGAQFGDLAVDYSEDPRSAPNRGDLGFIPLSVIQKYPPQLRDAVLNAKPGSAKGLGDNRGFALVLVLGKDPAGQKELTTPGVKEAITQLIKGRREQVLRAAYISDLRNGATIQNLMAKRVVESQGKVPGAK